MTTYTVHYWLKGNEGEVVDTSQGGEPMKIKIGSSDTIQGLQQAVEGRRPGDRIEVTIPPELAYGPHRPEFVNVVSRELFDVADLKPGMKFQTNTGETTQIIKVVSVDADGVTVDANHPLAGLTLVFELEIISVSENDN
jgi:FKBP-type peptidyl-prolyl cis-trans isomerase SlyD